MRGPNRYRRAFTLFELMIVVGIILLLVSILVPTIGKVRDKARATATRALITGIATNVESYYAHFHAYPGPLPTSITTANANKISGAQNMLLGLSYAMGSSSTPPGAWPFTPNTSSAAGPIDYASSGPTGAYEQLPPYFAPAPNNTMKVNGTLGATNALPNFPVVFDTFVDGLPILYFRRTVGVEFPVAVPNPSYGNAGYYVDENAEYTRATSLQATSGATFNQTAGSGLSPADLQNAAGTSGSPSTARGGFIIMSAGIDRYYGTYKGKNDDIFVVGGQ